MRSEKNSLNKMPERRIGVDLSESPARICVVSKGIAVDETDLQNVSEPLKDLLFSGVGVSVCAPFRDVVSESLDPPPVKRSKQMRVLPTLLDIKLPFSVEKARNIFIFTGGGRAVSQTVRDSDMESLLSNCAGLGINPESVLPAAPACWALAEKESPEWRASEHRVLCVAGKASSLVVYGGADGIRSCSAFGAVDPAGLVRRTRLAVGGTLSEATVFLAGSGAMEAAAEFGGECLRAAVAASPAFFVARSAGFANPDEFNLRTGPFVHPARIKRCEAKLRRASIVLAASGIIMAFAGFTVFRIAESNRRAVSSRMSAVVDTMAGYRIATKGERAAQDAKKAFAERIDPSVYNAAFSVVSSKRLPEFLRLCLEYGISLEYMKLSQEGVTASGLARDAGAAEDFVSALNTAGIRAVLSEKSDAAADGVSFFIHDGK